VILFREGILLVDMAEVVFVGVGARVDRVVVLFAVAVALVVMVRINVMKNGRARLLSSEAPARRVNVQRWACA
jgi:hypothetical protein